MDQVPLGQSELGCQVTQSTQYLQVSQSYGVRSTRAPTTFRSVKARVSGQLEHPYIQVSQGYCVRTNIAFRSVLGFGRSARAPTTVRPVMSQRKHQLPSIRSGLERQVNLGPNHLYLCQVKGSRSTLVPTIRPVTTIATG